jgi:hypothetical protein
MGNGNEGCFPISNPVNPLETKFSILLCKLDNLHPCSMVEKFFVGNQKLGLYCHPYSCACVLLHVGVCFRFGLV